MKRLLIHPPTTAPFVAATLVALAAACGHVGVDLDGDKVEVSDEGTEETKTDHEKTDERTDGTGETEATEGGATETAEPTDDTVEPTEPEPDPELLPDGGVAPDPDASVPDDGTPDVDGGKKPVVTWDGGEDPADRPDSSSDGTHVRDDAAVERDAAETEPEPEPERLPAECLPECGCDDSVGCDLACVGENCWPTCTTGTSCSIDVGETVNVGIECALNAVCEADGASADVVAYTCEGPGDCSASCGDASSCTMLCVGGGKCALHCSGSSSCTVECAEGSTCFVVREDTETEMDVACAADNRREWGDVVGCSNECP